MVHPLRSIENDDVQEPSTEEVPLGHSEKLPEGDVPDNVRTSSPGYGNAQNVVGAQTAFQNANKQPTAMQCATEETPTHLPLSENNVQSHASTSRGPPVSKKGRHSSTSTMTKVPSRRERIDKDMKNGTATDWAKKKPVDGYLDHPEAGPMMHPSFYEHLCPYLTTCKHCPICSDTRVLMAIRNYNRFPSMTTYRDQEIIWGVSRSTIQRKKVLLDERSKNGYGKADLPFLLCNFLISDL